MSLTHLDLTLPSETAAPLTYPQGLANYQAIQDYINATLKSWGPDLSTTAGLNWGYVGGASYAGGAWSLVAGGTVLLTASQTNYVERTAAGVVSANTAGFTAGRLPMAKVATSVGSVTTWDDCRTLIADLAAAVGTLGATSGGTAQSTWTLGDLLYANAANALAKLPGNTTATRKFLNQTGTGAVSAAPAWGTLVAGDVPQSGSYAWTADHSWTTSDTALTSGTFNPYVFNMDAAPAADSTAEYRGQTINATSSGTHKAGTLTGLRINTTYAATGTAPTTVNALRIITTHNSTTTLPTLLGTQNTVSVTGTGNITTSMDAGRFNVSVTAASTVTLAKGLSVLAPTISGGGSITTLVGIDIAAQTGGGTNRSIRTSTGVVEFGDTTEATNTTTASTTLAGDLAVAKKIKAGGAINPGNFTVATLPAGTNGDHAYATDGRKAGEGAGVGTGSQVTYSNGAWRRPSDETAIAA